MTKFCYTQFLFSYVLLFHFVLNKKKYYIQVGNNRYELTLNDNTNAQKLKQLIKDNNNNYNIQVSLTDYFLTFFTSNFSDGAEVNKTYNPGSILCNSQLLYYLRINYTEQGLDQIGQINESDADALNNYINQKYTIGNDIDLQFLLVNEKEKKETREKSTTLKMQEKIKILKRTINMKSMNFWKNIGWKLSKSFKSLLS